MTLRVVGAGLGRTGTNSLKLALERLVGEPCYHMYEVMRHPHHVPMWAAAARGEPVDWHALFADFGATVDWPSATFWRELADAYPDAVVLLSTRRSAAEWWRSADDTIFMHLREPTMPGMEEWRAMVDVAIVERFPGVPDDADAAMASYEAHNAAVRTAVPADRLLDWQPGDGWGPICAALGVPVPDEPFPHVNTTDDFRKMMTGRQPD
jgi:hypothetical protein